jgi:hypothetical protein
MSNSLPNLAPMRLGEIVLQTTRFDELRRWYILVLGLEPSLEHAVKGEPADLLKVAKHEPVLPRPRPESR